MNDLNRVFEPNHTATSGAMRIVVGVQLVLALVVWFFSPFQVLPTPPEVFAALGKLWMEQGLGQELITSFMLNVEALAWTVVVSLALCYFTVMPAFRPIANAVARGRFLGLIGLTFVFTLAFAAPALLVAQGRGGRGGFNAADSIKYKYASTPKLDALKAEASAEIDKQAKLIQVMVDKVFSFAEPGFQEFETMKYLTGVLEKNGFTVQRGYAGMPTAFVAKWGSGKPVISLGSDVDDIPQASNKPGVGYHDPQVTGAPGHGEGHNAGMPLNIAAAIVVKKIMEREKMPGTLVLWPGIAEELMSGKAWLVREGLFKDVDVTLFTHVGNDLGVSWGQSSSNALISAMFKFKGSSSHAAGAPWRGKSALDAVMLMATSWEYQREHMELAQRSHYIIPDGGDHWETPSRATAGNPDRLPERTITNATLYEFGPVTFPAYEGATAGMRSMTDEFMGEWLRDSAFVARLTDRVGLTVVEKILATAEDLRDATPERSALARATASASPEMSVATKRSGAGDSEATAMAMAPRWKAFRAEIGVAAATGVTFCARSLRR